MPKTVFNDAERAAIVGKEMDAMAAFDRAASMAGDAHHIHDHALALELGGLPSPDQHDALLAALQRRCDLGLKDAEEMLILGRWLVTESRGPAPAVTRLCRRLAKIDRAGGFTPLMAVLNDTARAGRGGIVSERQKDALDEIARAFKAS